MIDADSDGVLTWNDCDDDDVSLGAPSEDADCDGVLAEDCDDNDVDATVKSEDADCDDDFRKMIVMTMMQSSGDFG